MGGAGRREDKGAGDKGRGLRVGHEATLCSPPVAEGHPAADVDAAVEGAQLRHRPVGADPVELPLGHREHDPHDELAGRGREVEAV